MPKPPSLCAGLLLGWVAAVPAARAAPVTIAASSDATALARAIAGSGITIGGASYAGGTASAGFFAGGTQAGLSIDQGILLTTGLASGAGAPFAFGVPSSPTEAPGTPLIANSYDAVTLTFDFSSAGPTASFNYFFASAEYQGFVNEGFNDVFRFLFNGRNIALVPGTSVDVSVGTVNNGSPRAPGENPSNPQYYVDNVAGQNASFPYAGLTAVFSATLSGLTPGAVNSLTLVIADVNDPILDSAVFLAAGSFTSQPDPTPVPEPGSVLLFGAGLLGLATARRARGAAS